MPKLFCVIAQSCGRSALVYTSEGGAIGDKGILEQLAFFFDATADAKIPKCNAQIILGGGPILRQIGPGPTLSAER